MPRRYRRYTTSISSAKRSGARRSPYLFLIWLLIVVGFVAGLFWLTAA